MKLGVKIPLLTPHHAFSIIIIGYLFPFLILSLLYLFPLIDLDLTIFQLPPLSPSRYTNSVLNCQ